MRFALVAILAVAICHISAAPTSISKQLLKNMRNNGSADFMLVLKDEVAPVVESINSRQFVNSAEKTTILVSELRSFTKKSQEPILAYLNKAKVYGVKSFWITNRIFVPAGSAQLLDEVSTLFSATITEIREPHVARISYTVDGHDSNPQVIEWGVANINAPDVWADGHEGEGVVVSHIDTGVRTSHEAFTGALRDTHAWMDPYTNTQQPDDENGHGTHTMGTIVGRNGTGVAPKATFISCRGCTTTGCTEPSLLACGQFTTCPTQPDGSDEDCSKKPHLSSNSWGGGSGQTWFNEVIAAWRSADIVPIFAIGNSGPGCRSANSPGDQLNLISVGATTAQNSVAQFSSHGPTLLLARIKPEVSAPGNQVRSASHETDDGYATLSGTSMATPHVAGAVALLLSKNNALTFTEIANVLEQNNLRPRIESIICDGGGVNITYPWPNNSYGWGKIDIKLAADAAPSL